VKPDNRDVARPPERTFDRPTPAPTPRAGTWVAPEPRRQRVDTAPAPVPDRPVEAGMSKAETRRASPEKAEEKKAEPDEVKAKPTPTQKPKTEAAPQRRRVDPGGTND
jgi:ribonuclease E